MDAAELGAAVEAARERAGALVSVEALDAAWTARESPPARWLLVGRRSVGKTRLLNALLGVSEPVGLGGVTTEAASHAGDGLVLVDLPGIEDAFAGADRIEAHLPDVDGVLWVVDGLQPLTGIERKAMDDAVQDEVIVVVAVTRLDLVDPSEHGAILQRVTRLLQHRAVRAVLSVPRGAELAPLRAALHPPVPWPRSPHRRARLVAALDDVAVSLSHLVHDGAPDPAALAAQAVRDWEDAVADAREQVAERVREGTLLFRDEALSALHNRLLTAAEVLRLRLHDALGESPTWRPAPPEALDLKGQLQDLVRGNRAVLDGLDEGARHWRDAGGAAFEGVVRLPVARGILERRQAVRQAQEAVVAVCGVLREG